MRQPSLFQSLGIARPAARDAAPDGRLEVYDFFAGAGGFSEGARQAGCAVVWVCDNDPLALKTHAVNHPRAEHRLADLPLPRTEWPFPTDGRAFHAHFSPPCQKFSQLNAANRKEGDRDHAKNLVTWSVETALASGATSWSLEQVKSRHIVALLEAVKRRHPGKVEWAALDFAELGVPQTRTRLIAGPPELVAALMRRRSKANVRSARSAIAKPRGTYIRNSKHWVSSSKDASGKITYVKAGWGDHCFSLDRPAPTVVAARGLNWITRTDAGTYLHPRLNQAEYAALQTFPPTYRWPDTEQHAQQQIGNAVPPLVATLLLGGAAPAAPVVPASPATRAVSPSLRRPPRAYVHR